MNYDSCISKGISFEFLESKFITFTTQDENDDICSVKVQFTAIIVIVNVQNKTNHNIIALGLNLIMRYEPNYQTSCLW